MNGTQTVVIFRLWPQGDVLALFPEVPADVLGRYCMSYEHLGQHGGANYDYCVRSTRPAQPEEYRDLAAELERLGYDLKIIERARPEHHEHRRALAKYKGRGA